MYKLVKVSSNTIENMNIGIKVFKNLCFKDSRGELNIRFENLMIKNLKHLSFNESISAPMTGRGLHYQVNPFGQEKIIRVEEGEILDFFLDTNANDGLIYCMPIDAKMDICVYLPESFAHGFISLTNVKFQYLRIGEYLENKENTLNVLPSLTKLLNLGKINQSNKDSSSKQIEVIQ